MLTTRDVDHGEDGDVDVYRQVDELPLDRLGPLFAQGGLYDSADWLRYCERSAAGNMRHLVLNDPHDSEPTGLASMRIVPDRRILSLYDLSALLPSSVPEEQLFPNTVASVSGAHCVLLASDRGRAEAQTERVGRLARAVARQAETEGSQAVGFLHLRDPQVAQAVATGLGPDAGRPFLLGAHTELSCDWDDFDGYLATLHRSRRNKIRRERRQFTESGLTVRVLQGTGELDAATASLQLAVRERYSAPGTVESILADYANLGATVDQRIRVFLVERDGVPVGLSLALLDGDHLHLRLVGFDYAATGRDFVYFNVLFYEPLEWGLKHGITSYSFGSGGYTAKAARGAALVPSYAVVRWPEAVRAEAWQRLAEREEALRAELPLLAPDAAVTGRTADRSTTAGEAGTDLLGANT